ncbi:MAG: flagellar assembly peptidoglycan hydrolase FlgJ [Betaproteobacteria bacterium]|nr:flagellar assembly peptidoglycan hydrolase FlgJ [Betaproteobacteria bacterium]
MNAQPRLASSAPALPTAVPLATPGALAADVRALDRLRYGANPQDPASIKEAARQLESLFMRELIKSMREATMKSGLMDSAQGDLANDLLDQQLALQMSGMPGGLSRAIEQQLSRLGNAAGSATAAPASVSKAAPPARTTPDGASTVGLAQRLRGTAGAATAAAGKAATTVTATARDFVQGLQDAARRVADPSGIPAAFLIGQAAHETGWGRQMIRNADGSSSNNLFGIKADASWKGPVAEVVTTEYIHGVPQRVRARFRAYDSVEASLADYARLIHQSPRYAEVRSQTGSAQAWAQGLQRAGYATDPQYAAKLSRVIEMAQQRMA